MENLNIETIAQICIQSQSYDYLQENLFIRENKRRYYKIKMSKNNYSLVLQSIDQNRQIIFDRKGIEFADEKHVRKLYTEEEVEIMKVNIHLTCVQLAKILNRPVGSVNKKLTDLRKEFLYKK